MAAGGLSTFLFCNLIAVPASTSFYKNFGQSKPFKQRLGYLTYAYLTNREYSTAYVTIYSAQFTPVAHII